MVTRLGVQLMNHQTPGNIINICSMLGHQIYPMPTVHAYQVTKFGVKALTEAVRSELKSLGSKIRCGQLSPTGVATNILNDLGIMKEKSAIDDMEKNFPVPVLQVSDVYSAVKFMISTDSRCQLNEMLLDTV